MELSIIVTGRNDDWSYGFNDRLFKAIHLNSSILKKFDVDFEFIFVEWNPVPNKPLLSSLLSREKITCYVCKSQLHKDICTHERLQFLEFHAKNVGIRRANKKFVLCLNADIILSMNLIKDFSAKVNESVIYTSSIRKDIHLNDVERRKPIIHENWAPGDFTLCSKEIWNKVTGYDESITYSRLHNDHRIILQAEKLGIKHLKLAEIYHIFHNDCYWKFKKDKRPKEEAYFGKDYNFKKNLPYTNEENWGLSDREASRIDKNAFLIS